MKKGSRSKKAARRKLMLGSLLCAAVLCAGCGKKASEEVAQTQIPTTQETTTQAADSAPGILIQSDEEKQEDPQENLDHILFSERERKRWHDTQLPYRTDGAGGKGEPSSYSYYDEQ